MGAQDQQARAPLGLFDDVAWAWRFRHCVCSEAYLSFVKECDEKVAEDGADMAVPLRVDDYDRVARRVSAALMLRDKPITGGEAKEIAELVSGLLRHSRTMARILNKLSKEDAAAIEHEIEVLEMFKRCVDVAAEQNISFRIDF